MCRDIIESATHTRKSSIEGRSRSHHDDRRCNAGGED
jgi:hypothetical protein